MGCECSKDTTKKDPNRGGTPRGGTPRNSGKNTPRPERTGLVPVKDPAELIQCHFCDKSFTHKQLNSHTAECEEREVSCWNNWCRTIVKQKHLERHMQECEKNRKARCAKCGDLMEASMMSKHYEECGLVACTNCSETVIPRLVKYCPVKILMQTKLKAGPFAKEALRARIYSDSSSPCETSPKPEPDFGPLCDSSSASSPMHRRMQLSDGQKKNVHYNVARIQHMWRWAKCRAVYEDILFRLIYKEIDSKKESFSIFKSTSNVLADASSREKVERLRTKSAGPVRKAPTTPDLTASHYFPVRSSNPITVEHLEKLIIDYTRDIPLPYHAIYRIFEDAGNYLHTLPNVARMQPPTNARVSQGRWNQRGKTVVVGDLHGQLPDLLRILEENGLPSASTYYIFNGDFVDRGPRGLEIFTILCCLILVFPHYVSLNRGNHECDYMNEEYGFDYEVKAKYDKDIFKLIQTCFNNLPLCTLLGDKVFVVHGGVPRRRGTVIADIDRIKRFGPVPMPEHRQSEANELFQDLLWSDPLERKGWINSDRGVGVQFGADVTRAFLERNKLEVVIRSHEEFPNGYMKHHGGKLYTVFSASNYDGPDTNMGAYAILVGDGTEVLFTTFQVTEEDYIRQEIPEDIQSPSHSMMPGNSFAISSGGGAGGGGMGGMSRSFTQHVGHHFSFKQYGALLLGNSNHLALQAPNGAHLLMSTNTHRQTRDDVLRMIREKIFERKHSLLAYFSKVDRTRKGSVWKLEWTEAMTNVLNLHLPWFFLRPYIAEADSNARIHYVKFLRRFKNGLTEMWLAEWEDMILNQLYDAVFLASRSRSKLSSVGKQIKNRESMNYNDFCTFLREVDNNLSDNNLFHLWLRADSQSTGCINGADFIELLEQTADKLETTSVGSSSMTARPALAWDQDGMEQLQRAIVTGRAQLHTVFKMSRSPYSVDRTASAASFAGFEPSGVKDATSTQSNSGVSGSMALGGSSAMRMNELHREPMSKEKFVEGMRALVKSLRRGSIFTDAHHMAVYDYINQLKIEIDGVSLYELYMAFIVRDRFLLGQQRELFQRMQRRPSHSHPLARGSSFHAGSVPGQSPLVVGVSPPVELTSPTRADSNHLPPLGSRIVPLSTEPSHFTISNHASVDNNNDDTDSADIDAEVPLTVITGA